MKSKKLFLEPDPEEYVTVGLVRLAKEIADYEFFFHVNNHNGFCFNRIKDFVYQGKFYTYHFPVFQGYHHLHKTCYKFISNKSSESTQINTPTELFPDEFASKFLLSNHEDVDYIIKTTEPSPDFSLILLPENLAFVIQEFSLSSEDELFQLIQYYE